MGWLSDVWGSIIGRRDVPTAGEPVDEVATRVARTVQTRCAPLAGVLRSASLQVRIRGRMQEGADGAISIAPARETEENGVFEFTVDALQEPEEE